MTIQPIVLAGGKGTRMNNPDLPKPLVPLKGKPIMAYLLETLAESPFLSPTIITGYHAEKIEEYFGDAYRYVLQEQQLGTGHAVEVTEPVLKDTADVFLVMNGDHPLWTLDTMNRLIERHKESGATLSLVTLKTDEEAFDNFGRIIRNEAGDIVDIREYKDCTEEEKQIKEFNPALYCFNNEWLWQALHKVDKNNAQGEYYITDLLAIALQEGQPISSVEATNWQETLGINTAEQLEEVAEWI